MLGLKWPLCKFQTFYCADFRLFSLFIMTSIQTAAVLQIISSALYTLRYQRFAFLKTILSKLANFTFFDNDT